MASDVAEAAQRGVPSSLRRETVLDELVRNMREMALHLVPKFVFGLTAKTRQPASHASSSELPAS
jgi:hypothetical protein